ncbi:helix-turn-helix transcriptional regulator [Streptomyces sp. NPDC050263]|uniref:helix-turn-helix domain-containing protein n=1 Tax=Streptomyces sp. NPDC050263 TaxID=3155037 RepID=UPI003446BD38
MGQRYAGSSSCRSSDAALISAPMGRSLACRFSVPRGYDSRLTSRSDPASSPLPTARRRRLGTELRRLRERTGLTATQAAALVGATQSRVSDIEAGRYGVGPDRVCAIARHYDCTDEPLIDALAALTGERRRGRWEECRDILSPRALDLTEVEHHATALRVAHVINIPGLLQTPDHARALFGHTVPPLKPHEIEHRVSHRIRRQEILHREQPPPYTAIIHEAALRMRFGDRDTIRAQLHHPNEISELNHVTITVIPFESGPFHPSVQGIDYFHGAVPQLDTSCRVPAPRSSRRSRTGRRGSPSAEAARAHAEGPLPEGVGPSVGGCGEDAVDQGPDAEVAAAQNRPGEAGVGLPRFGRQVPNLIACQTTSRTTCSDSTTSCCPSAISARPSASTSGPGSRWRFGSTRPGSCC